MFYITDRLGPTAGFCGYDDRRTSAGDVGQVEICVDGSAVEPGRLGKVNAVRVPWTGKSWRASEIDR